MLNFAVIWAHLPFLLRGLKFTVLVWAISFFGAFALAILVASFRSSRFRVLRWSAAAYISFFRATPALVQIAWIYFVLPMLTGINLSPFVSATLALGLNSGAFQAEAIRTGLKAIPKEQYFAASSLHLSWLQTQRHVILPQAVAISLPIQITNMLGTLKQSALVSTISVADLMYQGETLAAITYKPIEFLTAVAVVYLVLTVPLARASDAFEKRWRIRTGR